MAGSPAAKKFRPCGVSDTVVRQKIALQLPPRVAVPSRRERSKSGRGFPLTKVRSDPSYSTFVRPKACYPKDTLRHSLAPADTILWRPTANAFQKALIRDS